jgi:OHCU decarboxylase
LLACGCTECLTLPPPDRPTRSAGAEQTPRTDGLGRLNALPYDDAVAAFMQCCAARAWAHRMAGGRPYGSVSELFALADRAWDELGPSTWREAFAGHPRLGQEKADSVPGGSAPRWSAEEQAGVQRAAADVRTELAEAQREYEDRFGHIFLICATGLGADEILVALRERMRNDAETELRVAAGEQARITRLRLQKLLNS